MLHSPRFTCKVLAKEISVMGKDTGKTATETKQAAAKEAFEKSCPKSLGSGH
ncbi:MAG: hypothetical protein WC294_06785 [Methanoregula sp.]|jgi:dsRNA-specific ribonuclease